MSSTRPVSPPPVGGVVASGPGSSGAVGERRAPVERVVLDAAAIGRAVTRMAHEIIERNHGVDDVVLLGLLKGGVWLADALAAALGGLGSPVPVGALDVSFHRDDLGLRAVTPSANRIEVDLHDRVIVLVDDVLYTGRTVRAALDALREYGRPRAVQLAVMVDRGHRELPIRPDYVGKNLPTSRSEDVRATSDSVTIR
jgi:pyrimidine operon attenuation protein / uracil phosphoribosyltransferase